MTAANAAGVGAGNALAGVIIDAASTRVSFAVAAGLLASAALLLLVRRGSLTERRRDAGAD